MPARPPGALRPGVTLEAVKARLATWRNLPGKGPELSDQDIRMDLRHFNHAQAAARAAGQEPPGGPGR